MLPYKNSVFESFKQGFCENKGAYYVLVPDSIYSLAHIYYNLAEFIVCKNDRYSFKTYVVLK